MNVIQKDIALDPITRTPLVGGARFAGKEARRLRLYAGLVIGDALAITLGFLGASQIYLGQFADTQSIHLVVMTLPLFLLIAINRRAYGIEVLVDRNLSIMRAVTSLAIALVVLLSIAFYLRTTLSYSRVVSAAGVACGIALLVVARAIGSRLARSALGNNPLCELMIVDGSANHIPDYANMIVHAQAMNLAPKLDDPEMLDRLGRLVGPMDRVVVSCPVERREAWAMALKGADVEVEVLAPELGRLGLLGVREHHGQTSLCVACGPLAIRARIMKRSLDLVIVAAALPFALIIGIIVAIAIKIDSPGPIFFKQDRIGLGNRLFPLYKFRSMRVEKLDNTASKLTSRNDNRVTRVGDFIRKTSIDELPQLINVLRGDMSIVGPRPHAVGALAGDSLYWEVDARYWQRHGIKPGMTGLAQIRGFRGTTFEPSDLSQRLQADLEYISDWSLWRDISIIMATFAVLVHRNAF